MSYVVSFEQKKKLPPARLTCGQLQKIVALMRPPGVGTHQGYSSISFKHKDSYGFWTNAECSEVEAVLEEKDLPRNPNDLYISVSKNRNNRGYFHALQTHTLVQLEGEDKESVIRRLSEIEKIFKENKRKGWWLWSNSAMVLISVIGWASFVGGVISSFGSDQTLAGMLLFCFSAVMFLGLLLLRKSNRLIVEDGNR